MDGEAARARLIHPPEGPPARLIPAATVVLLRDGDAGPEVLLVKRNSALEFAGGMWVFPGGRVDPADIQLAGAGGERGAARQAAAREAAEEAGIVIAPDELVELSHWTPPAASPKRFSTWFFAGRAPEGTVTVDGGEILDHRWTTPGDAIARRAQGDMELGPPTYITLVQISSYPTVEAALVGIAAAVTERFETHIVFDGETVLAVYDGDVAYEGGAPNMDGARHRLVIAPDGWSYTRTAAQPPGEAATRMTPGSAQPAEERTRRGRAAQPPGEAATPMTPGSAQPAEERTRRGEK